MDQPVAAVVAVVAVAVVAAVVADPSIQDYLNRRTLTVPAKPVKMHISFRHPHTKFAGTLAIQS